MVATDDERGTTLVCTERSDLPHMWVRGTWLGMQVVSVIPDHDQSQILHWCIHGSTGAYDEPSATPQHCQPSAVPLARAEVCGQCQRVDTAIGECNDHALDIAMVRNHDNGTLA